MKDEAAAMIQALRNVIQRLHYPLEVMLACVGTTQKTDRKVR